MRCAPLLLIAAACGSGPITAGAFPAAYGKAVCEVQSLCRQQAHFLEQQCEASASALFDRDLAKAIAAGKSRFDPAQAHACLDGLHARGCERTLPAVDQACERAVTGTVASGGSCNWLYECSAGRCDPQGPGACPATCGAVSGEGAPCGAAPCDLRAGLRCIDNVCSRLHTADQKCSSTSDCAIGLFCDNFSSKCAVRTFEQASCASIEECATGLFCDASAQGGLCRRKIPQGQSCTATSLESIRDACADGSVCRGFSFSKTSVTPGTCAATGELGASCVATAQITGCAEGLVCSGATCADKPVTGPCAQADDCKDGVAYCDGSQCHPLKADGVACAASSECASSFCDPGAGKCAEQSAACHEP
jgi:hypothetical protein